MRSDNILLNEFALWLDLVKPVGHLLQNVVTYWSNQIKLCWTMDLFSAIRSDADDGWRGKYTLIFWNYAIKLFGNLHESEVYSNIWLKNSSIG